jgi:hypothetical protein
MSISALITGIQGETITYNQKFLHVNKLCSDAVFPFTTHPLVPQSTLQGGRNVACSDGPVTEVFTFVTLQCVALNHRLENIEDLRLRYGFWKQFS